MFRTLAAKNARRKREKREQEYKTAHAILQKHNAYTRVNVEFVKFAIESTWNRHTVTIFEQNLRYRQSCCPAAHKLNWSFHRFLEKALPYRDFDSKVNACPQVAACIAIFKDEYPYQISNALGLLVLNKVRITESIMNFIMKNPQLHSDEDLIQKILSFERSKALLAGLHTNTGRLSLFNQLQKKSTIFDNNVLRLPLQLGKYWRYE